MTDHDTKFNDVINLRFGTDLEWILPFNKNKWGLTAGGYYQSYKSKKQTSKLYSDINFKSIDLSVGGKYYLFLKNDMSFFIAVQLNALASYTPGSKMEFMPWYSGTTDSYKIKSRLMYMSFGGGIEYKRIYAGLRYVPNQQLYPYPSWHTEYRKLSLIIGYKILKTGGHSTAKK